MRYFGSILAVLLALSAAGQAQITKTATFENYAAGTDLGTSFTDPLSGIEFLDSTHLPAGGFVANSDLNGTFFGNDYLTSGGGINDSFGPYFGFTADLPAPANHISLFAIYLTDIRSNMVLKGFDSHGDLIAQQSGPDNLSASPFLLEITSAQYNMSSFQISVHTGASAYDNISYTFLPEPGSAFILCIVPLLIGVRKRLFS